MDFKNILTIEEPIEFTFSACSNLLRRVRYQQSLPWSIQIKRKN